MNYDETLDGEEETGVWILETYGIDEQGKEVPLYSPYQHMDEVHKAMSNSICTRFSVWFVKFGAVIPTKY